MKLGFFFWSIALLVLVSCSEEPAKFDQPQDLITQEKMVDILKDLIILETHVKRSVQDFEQFNGVITKSGDALLKKKGVSPEEFKRSFDYYASHQEQMKQIYEEVLDKLNEELGKIQATSKN